MKDRSLCDIWVFGYGSLMWRPGFEYEEAQMATLDGYHRDLCVLSYVFRGTPEVPGLVMGLNPDGHCVGRAFRVAEKHVDQTLQYLDEREMINNVYEPSWVDASLEDDRVVQAFTFIARQDHAQYAGHFTFEKKVEYVLQGFGSGGSSLEYLENTCVHLRDLSIEDPILEAILASAHAQNA